MKCPTHNVEMVAGVAIKPSYGFCHRPILIKAHELTMVECLKCPVCGFSDDGINPQYFDRDGNPCE